MPKVEYVGAHESYTISGIQFKKDESINLADDQVATVKANGVGAKLFAKGDLVIDKPTAKKATDAEPVAKVDAKDKVLK